MAQVHSHFRNLAEIEKILRPYMGPKGEVLSSMGLQPGPMRRGTNMANPTSRWGGEAPLSARSSRYSIHMGEDGQPTIRMKSNKPITPKEYKELRSMMWTLRGTHPDFRSEEAYNQFRSRWKAESKDNALEELARRHPEWKVLQDIVAEERRVKLTWRQLLHKFMVWFFKKPFTQKRPADVQSTSPSLRVSTHGNKSGRRTKRV
jgi:hypothetical protein